MNRRSFMKKSTASVLGVSALSGCIDEEENPPRKSDVFRQVDVSEETVVVDLVNNPTVTVLEEDVDGTVLSGVSPIGVASAAKGRGAGGRSRGGWSSAPKTSRGRARWIGGAYVGVWYSSHDDDIEQVNVRLNELAIGTIDEANDADREELPGARVIPWDTRLTEINQGGENELPLENPEPGTWYRVGAQLVSQNGDRLYNWEFIDFELTETDGSFDVSNEWKVSPRI